MTDHPDRDVHPLDDATWQQAVRLVAGDCAPEEDASLRAWFAADPARQVVLDEATAAWHATAAVADHAPMPAWDADRALAAMLPRLPAVARAARGEERARSVPRLAPRPATRTMPASAWRPRLAAAAAVVVIGAGLAWRTVARDAASPAGAIVSADAVREERAAPGTPRRVVLDDGTVAELAPGSVLRTAARYGDAHRDVALAGEGRFTVAARPGAPRFRVRAHGVTVEDVSTVFVVRAAATVPRVQVGVVQGRVLLRAAGEATLDAGMVAEADSGAVPHALATSAMAPLVAAIGGTLAFDDAPLDEVVARIARWHGVAVTLGPGVPRDRRVTATFTRETPRQLLEAIAASTGLAVRTAGAGVALVVPPGR